MNLIKINELYEKHGIPLDHAEVFLKVAKEHQVVISTRTPGPACGLLLEQGYDAKSFWVKSKSCDWGPMSGFVCLDPYLNKSRSKGALDNIDAALKSLTYKDGYEDGKNSTPIPIRINEERWQWLRIRREKNKKKGLVSEYIPVKDSQQNIVGYHYVFGKYEMLLRKDKDGFYYLYYDVMKLYGITNPSNLYGDICVSFDKKMRKYISKTPSNKQENNIKKLEKSNEKFWKELKDKKYLEPQSELETFANGKFKHFRQLMAMTNAHKPYNENNPAQWHLNALTGDYDLFAVWPAIANDRLDSRIAGMNLDLTDKELIDREEKNKDGKVIGNITQRILNIAQTINSYLDGKPLKGSSSVTLKANRIYHSDEAGRPFVESVDSAIGFGPGGEVFEVREKGDAPKDLSDAMVYFGKKGYNCFINKGWDGLLLSDARPYIKYNKVLS